MEIFLRNIPPVADRIELIRALVPRLHGPDFHHYYIDGQPYNYDVQIFKDKNANGFKVLQNSRCGKLVVPTEAIGTQVLSVMYINPFEYHGRVISFQESKYKARQEELARLRGPYRDPEILQEEVGRHRDLQGELKLKKLWFGWPSRNGSTISIEWESPDEEWVLIVESHKLIIKSSKNLRIIIALRGIQSAALNSTESAYWLERPPTFEKGPEPVNVNAGYYEDGDGDYPWAELLQEMIALDFAAKSDVRTRLQSLDPTQNRLFPFLRVIGFTFDNYDTGLQYTRKASMIGLKTDPHVHAYERLHLYSEATFADYDSVVSTLPFEIAFQMEALLSRSHFNPKELQELGLVIWDAIDTYGEKWICQCIRRLDEDSKDDDPDSIMDLFTKRLREMERDGVRRPRKTRSDRFQCHRVMLTPTSMVLSGPLPDETNRVLRRYMDYQSNFIRVEIREEDSLTLRWDRDVDEDALLKERFHPILSDGFTIAGRKFSLLGWSTSALHIHAMWFVSPFTTETREYVTADIIRDKLGDFSKVIDSPARYAARIGQAFSATEASVSMQGSEVEIIADKTSAIGKVFTDGVGTASPEVFEEMWRLYTDSRPSRRLLPTPSAFQIRFGGAKGVLCVDQRLEGRAIRIRPSMNKFISKDLTVEICSAFDRPMETYLNRFLIMLLETLGVSLEPFMELQTDAVHAIEIADLSFKLASGLLASHGLGEAFTMAPLLEQLDELGLDPFYTDHPGGMISFLDRVFKFAKNHILRDLKYKARIPVPKAWTLVGVADEYDYLKEGEIYACIRTVDGHKEYIEGPVLISRSPTVHPGDARMVRAIGEPPADAPGTLRNLINCVVFNCKGNMSLPSMLAGGDLDGDIYSLILDERLHPTANYPPGDYDSIPDKKIDGHCMVKDLAQFAIDYIKNDLVGVIATQILLTADLSNSLMKDPECLALAALHSMAVDFPKTGQPAPRAAMPKPKSTMKPDWYATEMGENKPEFYPSQRIIGELFRAIELPAIPEAKRTAKRQRRLMGREINANFQPRMVDEKFDLRIDHPVTTLLFPHLCQYVDSYLLDGASALVGDMLDIFGWYSQELSYICSIHSLSKWTPISEEEVVAGSIVAKCSQPRMRKDRTNAMRQASATLCAKAKGSIEGARGFSNEGLLVRGWAAWKVSVAYEEMFGAKSFGLLALGVIFSSCKPTAWAF